MLLIKLNSISEGRKNLERFEEGGTCMSTVEQPIQRTVQAQDVKTFSLGQRGDRAVVPGVPVPGLGNVTVFSADVGSNPTNTDLGVTVFGLNFTTAIPSVVLLQPRQNTNQNFQFPDQFAVQVITTSAVSIEFLIRRIDGGSATPLGWGQDLRIDMLVID
jgi:hypothetical protein